MSTCATPVCRSSATCFTVPHGSGFRGLSLYTNPGTLLAQATGIRDIPMPRLALPPVEIGQVDFDKLAALHEEVDAAGRRKISMGTLQEVKEVLGA